MDRSSRSTAVATAAVVVGVALAIAALMTVRTGSGEDQSQPQGESSAPTAPPTTSSSTGSGAPSTPPTSAPTTSDPAPTPSGPSASGQVCVPQVTQQTIRVMTFNIKSARVSGRANLAAVGDQIAAYQPDIVLMQEVDKGRAWSGRIDMTALLGERLQMQSVFGGNDVRSPTNMLGNATLSRFPILASDNLQLPARPGKHRRGLLSSTVDVDGIELRVFNTHLEHTSNTDRERQMAVVADAIGATTSPAILGGDLNAGPAGSVLARARSVARDTWQVVGSGPGHTAPAGRPRVRIDYLMYAGGADVEVAPQQMQVLPTNASDHRAVMATYQLRRDDGEVCLPSVVSE